MRANSLEKQLQNRPKPEDLIKEGILEGECIRHKLSMLKD